MASDSLRSVRSTRSVHKMLTAGAATSDGTAAVAEAVHAAAAAHTPLRLVGRGTWLDAGRPVRATTSLSLAPLAGVVDYTPGDLTLTAGV
jgi:hypothetical protein